MTDQIDAVPGHDDTDGHVHARIPAWVTWAVMGLGIGIMAWAAWDAYRENQLALELEDLYLRRKASGRLNEKMERFLDNHSVRTEPKPVADEVAPDPVL